MKALRKADGIAIGLMTIGALNWGLASMARRDAVGGAYIKRSKTPRFIYGLVGISALYKLVRHAIPKSKQQKRREAIDRTMYKIEDAIDRLSAFAKDSRKSIDHGRKQIERYQKATPFAPSRRAWR